MGSLQGPWPRGLTRGSRLASGVSENSCTSGKPHAFLSPLGIGSVRVQTWGFWDAVRILSTPLTFLVLHRSGLCCSPPHTPHSSLGAVAVLCTWPLAAHLASQPAVAPGLPASLQPLVRSAACISVDRLPSPAPPGSAFSGSPPTVWSGLPWGL